MKILNENVDNQSQNTHVEVNIFARQKSKAKVGFELFKRNLHITQQTFCGFFKTAYIILLSMASVHKGFVHDGAIGIRTSARAML